MLRFDPNETAISQGFAPRLLEFEGYSPEFEGYSPEFEGYNPEKASSAPILETDSPILESLIVHNCMKTAV
jgi:hypothetical protein